MYFELKTMRPVALAASLALIAGCTNKGSTDPETDEPIETAVEDTAPGESFLNPSDVILLVQFAYNPWTDEAVPVNPGDNAVPVLATFLIANSVWNGRFDDVDNFCFVEYILPDTAARAAWAGGLGGDAPVDTDAGDDTDAADTDAADTDAADTDAADTDAADTDTPEIVRPELGEKADPDIAFGWDVPFNQAPNAEDCSTKLDESDYPDLAGLMTSLQWSFGVRAGLHPTVATGLADAGNDPELIAEITSAGFHGTFGTTFGPQSTFMSEFLPIGYGFASEVDGDFNLVETSGGENVPVLEDDMFVDGFPVAAHFNLQYFFAIEDLEFFYDQ